MSTPLRPLWPKAPLLLLLSACVSTKSAESTLKASEDVAQVLTQRVEQGPGRVVTTVEEFVVEDPQAAGSGPQHPDGGSTPLLTRLASAGAPGVPTQGLLRRTVTITERGPSEVTTSTETHAETKVEAKTAEAARSAPSVGCGLGIGLWLTLALCLLLGAGILYLRLRL